MKGFRKSVNICQIYGQRLSGTFFMSHSVYKHVCDADVCVSMQDVVFNFLTTDDIHLNKIDAEDPEVSSVVC